MKLEQVGPTVISSDGKYSEDTTIRVTAVDATTGATISGFAGTVNIAEIPTSDGIKLYSQNTPNGANLPSSVSITRRRRECDVCSKIAGRTPDRGERRPITSFRRASSECHDSDHQLPSLARCKPNDSAVDHIGPRPDRSAFSRTSIRLVSDEGARRCCQSHRGATSKRISGRHVGSRRLHGQPHTRRRLDTIKPFWDEPDYHQTRTTMCSAQILLLTLDAGLHG